MKTNCGTAALLLTLGLSAGLAQAGDRPLRVVDEGDIGNDWAPAGVLAGAPYPAASTVRDDVCVSVGYKLNRDGSTSDLSLLKVWKAGNPEVTFGDESLKPFLQTAAAVVMSWRFQAREGASANRVVYTSATIPFVALAGSTADSVRDHCRIADLKSFLAQAQVEANKRGNLGKAQYERQQRQINPMEQAALNLEARSR